MPGEDYASEVTERATELYCEARRREQPGADPEDDPLRELIHLFDEVVKTYEGAIMQLKRDA